MGTTVFGGVAEDADTGAEHGTVVGGGLVELVLEHAAAVTSTSAVAAPLAPFPRARAVRSGA